ncbi:hypothetical protein CORC01_03884 [Colletotrichum orchidophilum]|uniref:Heterokaryon incompatibility domain-containing protein n=1 Tax=Colletotrichum orchidophilum TaxID=1209926 RepID=A0A1G4BH19_9PEZI|nr:uncharacterized protein CORC01_03884 [Colletotrichum orchidophilum]OHF00810.1 hypothetical protein CORC01_03884 [Colletotrichum orchidophilum]
MVCAADDGIESYWMQVLIESRGAQERLTALEDIEDYWPRRLLHIPTLTSVERDENNVYGATEKPKYSILTYTWGRWKVRNGNDDTAALPVKGAPWKIPSIQEAHFTVASFRAVIEAMASQDVQWAWVDIACIHQEDEIMNAEEVGHQVAIFDKAVKAHVWLSGANHESLTKAFYTINEEIGYLTFSSFRTTENYLSALITTWADIHLEEIRMATTCKAIDRISSGLLIVLQDPWFSSLWTLQEAVLRNDALILSSEGLPCVWTTTGDGKEYQAHLSMFVNVCNNIYLDLINMQRGIEYHEVTGNALMDWEFDLKSKIDSMLALLIRSGTYNLPTSNPNIPYSMARYRQTSRPVDRIYGIMQTYNLRVGKVIRPQDNPSLADLVQEFAVAIATKNPILCQLFVHTKKADKLSSWRITENSFVPANFRTPTNYIFRSKFYPHSHEIMRASGRVCRLTDALRVQDDLVQFLHRTDKSGNVMFIDRVYSNGRIRIMTDEGFTKEHLNLNGYLWQLGIPGFRWLFPLSANLPIVLRDLWIFHLGDVDGDFDSRIRKHVPRSVGVLLRPAYEPTESARDGADWANVPHTRVGLCTWSPWEDEGRRMMDKDVKWKSVDFEFF